MYHLVKHRCFYYLYFADVKISEGMYKQQSEKELARLIERCYDSDI